MKKHIILLFMLFAAFGHEAIAQVKFGLRGGFNLTSSDLSNRNYKAVFDSKTSAGFFIGPTLELRTLTGVGFDISAIYNNKRVNLAQDEGSTTKSTQYIEVPLNLRISASLGPLGLFAATGPQVSWVIGDDLIDFLGDDNNYELNKSTFSWNAGGGINIGNIRLGYTYNIALGNTAQIRSQKIKDSAGQVIENSKLKTNSHQIYLTYFF